jgi:hypothetical protein
MRHEKRLRAREKARLLDMPGEAFGETFIHPARYHPPSARALGRTLFGAA